MAPYDIALTTGAEVQTASVTPQGGAPTRYYTGHAAAGRPAWSPTGDRLAYTSTNEYYTNPAVRILDVASGNSIAAGPGGSPDWSADGARIVSAYYGDVAVFDVSGGGAEVEPTGYYEAMNPLWAPGSNNRFAYVRKSSLTAPLQLRVRELGGTEFTVAEHVTGYAWSPSGDAIAYSSPNALPDQFGFYYGCDLNRATVSSLAVTDTTRMVRETNCAAHLAWAPDGSRLAWADRYDYMYFVSLNAAFPVYNPDLTRFGPEWPNQVAGSLQWTPDGQMIAFAEQQDYYFAVSLLRPGQSGAPTEFRLDAPQLGFEFKPVP